MKRVRELLRFDGRLSRLGYWRATLWLMIALGVTWAGALLVIMLAGRWGGALLLPLFPILVAAIAIGVRRLHDRSKSAWWLIPYGVLPLGASAWLQTQGAHAGPGLVLVVALTSLILSICGWVEIGFRRGTRGANRFGDEPVTGH